MMMNGLLKESIINKIKFSKMGKIRNMFLSLMILALTGQIATAQLNSWIGSPKKDDAENAHTIYREALKAEQYDVAFQNWQIAYDIAPTADGKRDYHFIDGVKLYIHKYGTETDAAKKTEYKEIIDKLYSQAIEAYETRAIKPTKCGDDDACYDEKIGYVYGRKGYDMFYTLNAPYSENLAVYDLAFEKAGNDIEYTVFDPVSAMVVYQYQKGKMDKNQVLDYYKKMEAIAEYNFENNERLGTYYDQAWRAAKAKFGVIETEIFDCDFFKPAYKDLYEENPDDMENLRNIVGLLKKRGCPETDELLIEYEAKWKKYAATVNAERLKEFEENNPGIQAKKLYDAGDYEGAIEKYDEAIAAEADPEKKASYMFSKASIYFRKLKKYATARKTAMEAVEVRPGWGRPIMLIGDMYATTARNCGDDWNQRLAIIAAIDKYNYAKSIDPNMAEEANNRASKYQSSLPEQSEGFMRGKKKGDSAVTGCWIAETVKVRFK